ncbi:hypothetical protein, partial [Furfurilactobacillus entadae]|uniref:hypothetical protein n=1 Tax=Furfurilactobacillus entadae TaxID=2922307 RepID=UPI0038B31100
LLTQQERQLPTDLRQNARLKRAYQRLPTDPKVKSISSNAKAFAASRQAIEAYVSTTLAQSTAYQDWQTTGQALGTRFTTLYGQRGQDYLAKQRRELKKRLGNQVLRALYASDSEPIAPTERLQTEAELTAAITQRTRQLKQTQQPAEQQQIKQELAKLKYRLRRQRGLAQVEAFTTARQALLDQRLPASSLQTAQLTALAEQAQLAQLKIRPQRRLTAAQKQTLTQLGARYYHANDGNYTRQGIDPVTEQVFQLANRRVTETLALIEQTPGPMVSQIYGQPVATIKKRLQIEQQALRLKHEVNMNNQQLKAGHEGAWQQQNHQLIEQLRKLALPSIPELQGEQQMAPSLRRQYQKMEPASNRNLRARQPTR